MFYILYGIRFILCCIAAVNYIFAHLVGSVQNPRFTYHALLIVLKFRDGHIEEGIVGISRFEALDDIDSGSPRRQGVKYGNKTYIVIIVPRYHIFGILWNTPAGLWI